MFVGLAATEVPWWWAWVVVQEQHIHYIREKGAYDAEKLVAPREYWPLGMSDELDEWHEDREKTRKRKEGQGEVLDKYDA